jgi:hypothetical protein
MLGPSRHFANLGMQYKLQALQMEGAPVWSSVFTTKIIPKEVFSRIRS